MSADGCQPVLGTVGEHLIAGNGYADDHTILSSEHHSVENSIAESTNLNSAILLENNVEAESIILEDETLSVQISYPETTNAAPIVSVTTVHTSSNPDVHNIPSSPKVSTLFRHKEHPEVSPFKEAIKGFVLSKLAKKHPTVSDVSAGHSHDGERRTIFSGIKEKLAKKLEDSGTKETAASHHSDINVPEKIVGDVELRVDLVSKSECELKSVVANDKVEGDAVEEAEECFEETKKTFKELSINSERLSFSEQLAPPPLGTPRSRTISNLSASSYELLKPEASVPDKTLSISFSDLKRADDLDIDYDMSAESTNVPEIHLQPCATSSDLPTVDTNIISQDTDVSEIPSSKTVFIYFKSMLNAIRRFYSAVFKTMYVLIVIFAILIYWLHWNNNSFLAGIVCGIAIFTIVHLTIQEFTGPPKQDSTIHFPDYKTLPPLKIPIALALHKDIYEGWMNQLMGDYDQESFKLCNATSVYVRIEGQSLQLSYPKKEVPKRAMWNEKLPHNNIFIREERHILRGAKLTLLPEDLPKTRIWCKRYPFCITLPQSSERQRSPSMDCSSLVEDKPPPPSPTKPSTSGIHSLPASLSGSPVHAGVNQKNFYLFARTDREKEEWYWRFHEATTGERVNSCYMADDFLKDERIMSTGNEKHTAAESGKTMVPASKEDKLKAILEKPVLNFNHYMSFLMKEVNNSDDAEDKNSLRWLNVFLGRLFYDFLTQKKWSDNVQQRIQRKLNRIKMPSYMQGLIVTDVYLGTSLPQIRRTSEPVLDERGLWIDLDIEYKGSLQMTLETKIKLQLQTKRDVPEDGEKTEEHVAHPAPVIGGELIQLNGDLEDLSDDDDLPDSETSKEDSSISSTPRSTAHVSTGARLLLTVERWVNSTNLAENKFVKKCVGHLTQTPLVLTVEMNALCGTLALNLPPLATDRLWYGFRTNPELCITVCPKVGERHINYTPIVQYIKKKLLLEFQKAVVIPNMDDFTVPFMHSTVHGH